MDKYWVMGLGPYLAVSWLLGIAKSRKAKRFAGTLLFGSSYPVKLGILASTAVFTLLTAYFSIKGATNTDLATFSILAAVGPLALPKLISINDAFLKAESWWGGSTTIKWPDVTRLEYHRGPATTIVVGKDGSRISHSGFHDDSARFQQECLSHTDLKMQYSEL